MDIKTLVDGLTDTGYGDEQKTIASKLFKSGSVDELIRYLKKCRCSLMDELHESQRRVDRMDYLIRKAEKEGLKEEAGR